MKLTVKDIQGQAQGEVEVTFPLVEESKGSQAVHDAVVAYQAAQRSGTACTKTMGEVAGSGKKPWRQKGTGRARAGSFASPLWRGGGVVFGPKPRDFRKILPKGVKQLALRKALTERLKAEDVILVDDLKIDGPRTKQFKAVLNALQVSGTVLFVSDQFDQNTRLSARNLAGVALTKGDTLNTYEVLRYDKLVFTKAAFARVEERLKGSKKQVEAKAGDREQEAAAS